MISLVNPQQPLNTVGLDSLMAIELQHAIETNLGVVLPMTKPCLHQQFEAQVEQTPDAVAVVFETQELTYAELNRRANQLAHYLQTLGVEAEVLVGICLERSLEMVMSILATLKAIFARLDADLHNLYGLTEAAIDVIPILYEATRIERSLI